MSAAWSLERFSYSARTKSLSKSAASKGIAVTDGGESIELIAACCPAPLSACCCSFIRSMPGGGIGGILPSANAAMLSHCQRTISPSSSRLWPCSSMCALVILKYSPD